MILFLHELRKAFTFSLLEISIQLFPDPFPQYQVYHLAIRAFGNVLG